MPRKNSGKSKAAQQREAKKKGISLLPPPPDAKARREWQEEQYDSNYVDLDVPTDSSSDEGNFDLEETLTTAEAWSDAESLMEYVESDLSGSESVAAKEEPTTAGIKRKRQPSNADLFPQAEILTEDGSVSSRSTDYRNRTGKTKKARAINGQPSIAALFKVLPKAKFVPAEEEASDSDIEMHDGPSVSITISPSEERSTAVTPSPSIPDLNVDSPACTSHSIPEISANNSASASHPRAESEVPIVGSPDSANQEILDKEKLRQAHSQFRGQIKKLQKSYRSKKKLQSGSKVFEAIVNLEALDMYNDEFLRISLRRATVKEQLTTASCGTRAALRKKLRAVSSPVTRASEIVAARCCKTRYYARRLREMAAYMERTGELLENKQGQGAHHESFLTIPGVYSALQIWVKGEMPFEEGGFNGPLRPAKMSRYINDFLFPQLKIKGKISDSTAVRCFPEKPPELKDGEKIHYPIFHDETCVHANDQSSFVWMREGEQPLRDKSRGRIVHFSEFILEKCGRLSLSPEECTAQDKLPVAPKPPGSENPLTVPAVPGPVEAPKKKGRKKKQTAEVKNAIEIFNIKFPDGVAVFIFDCSSAHEAFASDALLAHKMNRGPGGKQPKMRDTIIPGTQTVQSMVFPADCSDKDKDGNALAGQAKGMEYVLRERGLFAALEAKNGGKVIGTCATCKLSQAAREKAMKEAKAREDEIEGSGLENIGGRGISALEEADEARAHFREQTDGKFPTAKKLVPECLNSITTLHIRKFFRHCWRYMDAYQNPSVGLCHFFGLENVKSYRIQLGSTP
ncbi:hypothetical protein C8J56DRAFT_1027796 [Mycena floridula]|nr:hypothetical protein C8J56DRAFT_1027796 [Mycena floridula]